MYKFRRDQVLDPEFLTKLVERFKKEYVPRFIRDQQYYEVKTEILKRTMTDGNRDLNTQPVASWVKRYTETGICERNTKASIPKTVIAKAGDSLWNLACRYYGDGSRWKEIAAANGMTEDDLTGGERLVIPD